MFEVTIGLQEVARVETFTEAFKIFFDEVKKMAQSGASLYVIERTNFIVFHGRTGERELHLPMNMKQAGEFAYRKGLIRSDDEKEFLADPMPEVSAEEVTQAFLAATDENIDATLHELSELANKTSSVFGG